MKERQMRRHGHFLLFVELILFLSGCSKLKVGSFVMPSWDTQLAAPMFNRAYTLQEILWKDSTLVSHGDTTFIEPVGSIGTFSLFRTQPLGKALFAGKLKIDSSSSNYAEVDSLLPVGQTIPAVPSIPQRKAFLFPDLPFQNFSSATISNGTLTVTIRNSYPATIDFNDGLDIMDSSNNQIILNIPIAASLAPNQTYTTTQSLAGYTFPNNLVVSFVYSSPGSNVPAEIQSDTLISISLRLSESIASSIKGEVHLKDPIDIPADTEKVDLGDFKTKFSGGIIFSDSTKLRLKINLTGGFPSFVHLVLIPSNDNVYGGPVDSAIVEQIIYPGSQTNVVSFGPDFVRAVNRYSEAYHVIPNEFIMSGYVIVNPGPTYASGTITDKDSVTGTGTVILPFDLAINNATFTDTTGIDSGIRKKLNYVDSGRVVFETTNGLPLDIVLITQFIDTLTGNVVMNFPSDSIRIPAANIFNADGTVRTPMFSHNEIFMTKEEAKALSHSNMKFIFRLATPLGSQTVPFTANSTISLKVYANLAFEAGQDTFK
jgi:hypothetical protein